MSEFSPVTIQTPNPIFEAVNKEDFLPVMIPTYTGKGPIETTQILGDILNKIGRPYKWITASRITGVATAKTIMFDLAKNQLGVPEKKIWRGLILEDDVVIPPGAVNEIVDAIHYADTQDPKLNIVTNLWIPGMGWSIFHKNVNSDGSIVMKPYSDQELTDLPNFSKIDTSGIGFYYGEIYLDYKWHDGTCIHCTRPECMLGQDFSYYNDNNIQLSFFKFADQKNRLLHQREVCL